MDSTRLPTLIWIALVTGAAGSCSPPSPGGEEGGVASDVAIDVARDGSTEAPGSAADLAWRAEADGPSLHDFVVERARTRAASPYRPPDTEAARPLASLTYGQQRAIRFRSDAAVWRGTSAFELQFFHPGGGFRTPVRMLLVEGDRSRTFALDPALFDVGDELEGVDLRLPDGAGFSGVRALYPMNEPHRVDEVVSFLGASYFRLLGPGHVYGLSSRGLAVGTAGPDGEEFPDFVAFWLVRPAPADTTFTFFGLLDGPSVAGAYRFDLTPGTPATAERGARGTVLEVDARLFARRDVPRLGVAPLTSMYLHGTFRPGGDDDVRPRVHDSEGLLMETSKGEWIWRPLTNRATLQVTSLRDREPRGFGLAQRDRDFDHYLDLEALYHRRPSQWVEALEGDWGAGGVELVEIPTTSEFQDNVVAYWAPDGGIPAREERRFRYRLTTFDAHWPGEPVARVARTRIGWDALPGQADPPPRSRRRVVVDFAGGRLDALAPETPVEAVVSASSGEVADLRVQPLPGGGRRATFALVPDGGPVDLRLRLLGPAPDTLVSETWSYLWRPDDGR